MRQLKGVPVSPGIVIGEVFVLDDERRRIPRRTVAPEQVAGESQRLKAALAASIAELSLVRQRTQQELGEEPAKIFAFHLGMLADRSLTVPMEELIAREMVTAEYAVYASLHQLAERFAGMGDAAFKTKVDDVNDLSARVLKHLIGEQTSRLAHLQHRAVVMARDLTPSQAAAFNRSQVLGFVTEAGGKTGHTGIFARALQIPAVVGCPRATDSASNGAAIILDGDTGTVILDPDEPTLARYRRLVERQVLFKTSLSELGQLPCVTSDGTPIDLQGNIEFPEEIPSVLAAGGQGVGLYRTEFLYLAAEEEPTEELQFQAYAQCLKLLQGRPITIRTLDLGADKYTQAQAESPERNPMLGLRSIRFCLHRKDIFRRQLRAILRASGTVPPGQVRVMFPLISKPEELRQARFFFNDVMEDLRDEGVPHDPAIKLGMMVEVPSAAILADVFARQADFFSIGTNDLVQYTLAVDRTNEAVADMYNPANPAVVALIRQTAKAAREARIPVSLCGESAGDLEYTMLLVGLGLRTLSASPAYLPPLKRLIRSVSIEQCERVAETVAQFDSDEAVSRYLRTVTRKIIPEAFEGRSNED